MAESGIFRRRTWASVIAVLGFLTGSCGGAATQSIKACGPFGDPPADLIKAEKPYCLGAKRLGPWKDSNGSDRYACLYEPPDEDKGPLPLVVYLHPSFFGTETIHLTYLLHYQKSLALGADGRPGFIVLEPTGRKTTHYYPFPDQTGVGWDNWYRQFNPAGDVTIDGAIFKENVDAAAIDHFIAQEIASGKVERKRIYVTGWSNGAAMAYLYALNRPNIAALAVYSAPDPFAAFNDPCPQKPVAHKPANYAEIEIFNRQLPNLHIHNNCDVAGLCPNCELLTTQLETIGMRTNDIIVDSMGKQVSGCMRKCGAKALGDADPSNPLGWTLGLVNHSHWPLTWTRTMLEFLRDHPLK